LIYFNVLLLQHWSKSKSTSAGLQISALASRLRYRIAMRTAMKHTWMKHICKSVGICFALVAPVLAQSLVSAPKPAASGPPYDLSVGYANLITSSSGQHQTMSGLDVNGTVDFSPRFGAMLDSMYVRTSDVLGTQHAGYQLNFLGGPVFYPLARGNTRFLIHGLAGAALVDGAVPINATDYYHGWLMRFSYAAGGGFEHALSGPFGIRVQADYLHSAFFDATGAVRPQGSIRLTASLVFRPRAVLPSRWE
jgi:hypothetical protein